MSDNNTDSIDPAGSDPVEPDADLHRASHIPTDAPPESVPPVVPPRPPLPESEAAPSTISSSGAQNTRGRWLWPVITGVTGLALGAILGSVITGAVTAAQYEAAVQEAAQAAEDAKSSLFEDAASRCGLTGVVEIEDDGRTMIVDGEGEDFGSGEVDFTGLDCIIDAVGTPASVSELMYQTRSLDGRQSGDWDDVSASWSYHPDDGLDIIFEIED